MSHNHHPYSMESLCATLGEAPPPPPPDGSTLRRKTQWMAGKSKAQRLEKKRQKQQGQQDPPTTATCQDQDHGPLLPQVQPESRPRRRTRSQVAQHAPLPTPTLAPLLSLGTTVTRGLCHLRLGAQQPHKDPKSFDSPHTLKVRAWQEDFGYNIQVAYHDQKIQELGESLTKDEMEVAGILMSLSRPLPPSAAEQHHEKIARPPIWSKPVAMQAAVGIGLLGKGKEIKMPKPLGKIKI